MALGIDSGHHYRLTFQRTRSICISPFHSRHLTLQIACECRADIDRSKLKTFIHQYEASLKYNRRLAVTASFLDIPYILVDCKVQRLRI